MHKKFLGICFNLSAKHFLRSLQDNTVYLLTSLKIIMATFAQFPRRNSESAIAEE